MASPRQAIRGLAGEIRSAASALRELNDGLATTQGIVAAIGATEVSVAVPSPIGTVTPLASRGPTGGVGATTSGRQGDAGGGGGRGSFTMDAQEVAAELDRQPNCKFGDILMPDPGNPLQRIVVKGWVCDPPYRGRKFWFKDPVGQEAPRVSGGGGGSGRTGGGATRPPPAGDITSTITVQEPLGLSGPSSVGSRLSADGVAITRAIEGLRRDVVGDGGALQRSGDRGRF